MNLSLQTTAEPWADMLAHRTYMVRFAERRLHDPTLAEDVVHDVFEAALTGHAVFASRSSLRTWLTGVLKHKIVDLMRDRGRHQGTGHAEADEAEELVCPAAGPDEVAAQRQWLRRTLQQIETLPEGLRRAVDLRLLQDQPAALVCRTLGISPVNLHVRLHRARQRLTA